MLVMRADNNGEGGIMALLGLAAHSESDRKRRIALLMLRDRRGGPILWRWDDHTRHFSQRCRRA